MEMKPKICKGNGIANWLCKLYDSFIQSYITAISLQFISSSKFCICWIGSIKCVVNIESTSTRCLKFAQKAIFDGFCQCHWFRCGKSYSIFVDVGRFRRNRICNWIRVLDKRTVANFLVLTILPSYNTHLALMIWHQDKTEWYIRWQVLSLSVKALTIVTHNYYNITLCLGGEWDESRSENETHMNPCYFSSLMWLKITILF